MLSSRPNDFGNARRLDALRWEQKAAGQPHCLIVLCHGVRADGRQLGHLVQSWRDASPESVFSAPHAPFPYRTRRSHWLPWLTGEGREWFSLIDRSPAAEEAGIRVSAPLLDSFIDAELRRFALPPDAYVLAGFSQGAMIALFCGLRRPAAPRAVLCYAGGLVAPEALADEIRNHAPVLLVHGEADNAVSPARSRGAEPVLRSLGVPVETLYLAGLGHAIDSAGRSAGAAFLHRVLSRDACRVANHAGLRA